MDPSTTSGDTGAQASVADTDFVKSGNDASFVRLIKEAAIFRYDLNDSVGELKSDWKPGSGKLPFGYFSEDGITVHPESGDSNDFTAHNGDNVLSVASGGYWTFQFAALESKKEVLETYFDATVAPDGSMTVTGTDITKYAQYVIAGLTQAGNLIIVHLPKAQVNEREDFQWNISNLLNYGMTLRTYKGGTDTPYMWKAWGMAKDITPNT